MGELQLRRCCQSNKRVNMADKYRKFSSSSHSEDWKMTRYISGISISRFASFLAWTGLVSSLIFILGSLDMIFTPLALGIHSYSRGCGRYYENVFCGSLFGVGAALLLLNIGMFIYSFKLWRAINNDNMMGMRNLIKIGCYSWEVWSFCPLLLLELSLQSSSLSMNSLHSTDMMNSPLVFSPFRSSFLGVILH